MLVKSWKLYKKYFIFLFFIFLFLFKINNASALTNKGYGQVNWTTSNSHSYTIVGSGSHNYVFRFDALTNENNYDFIGFRANPLYYTTNYIEDLDDNWCNEWTAVENENVWGSDHEFKLQRLYCSHTFGTSPNINPSYTNGTVGFSAFIGGGGTDAEPCFYTKEYEGILLCPLKSGRNYLNYYGNYYDATDTQRDNPNVMHYEISISNMVLFYNNDTSEVLHSIDTTNTYIQNFNNYVSNTDTTQSSTNSTNALTGLSQQFNSHLGSVNELTRFVFLPVNFILDMVDTTCQPLIWDIPFVNTRVVVPCMSSIYNSYFSAFISIFSTVITGLLTYRCCMKLLSTIKGVLDAEDDKIEVIDL